MKKYNESLSDLNKSLEIEPNNAEALSERGETNHKIYGNLIEWIPFEKLDKLQFIGEGGFGTIFSAIWLDGKPIIKNNLQTREQSCKVALKTLSSFKELENHVRCRLNGLGLEIYGITQNAETQTCLMVFQYANKGSLYKYLASNFNKLDWENKLMHLIEISDELARIHKSGYVHCDFHSGNILLNQYSFFIRSFITDLRLSKSLKELASKGDIYGVMPYIAPELLQGGKYTQASDIYSLGIIMAELSTGKRPFYGYSFDIGLALDICKGLRPGFS
ncbi:kinase-like domain-containing protein [Gigaspora rosea]|uniref:Kinase-like domain-containing protein n=1 Tax=Gigaspora rosea TaxID=44941 RepID=A0A397W0S7_9GLOM|nr:kinase-like domain-containing protein [Gigaspora rosea]